MQEIRLLRGFKSRCGIGTQEPAADDAECRKSEGISLGVVLTEQELLKTLTAPECRKSDCLVAQCRSVPGVLLLLAGLVVLYSVLAIVRVMVCHHSSLLNCLPVFSASAF